MAVQTVPLFKNEDQASIRPIGMRNPLLKALHAEVVQQNVQAARNHLEPEQLAMAPAGGQKLVFSVRGMAELHPQWPLVLIDVRNAFNEAARAALIEALMEAEELRHLAWLAAMVLEPACGLETSGEIWGEAEEGFAQGDPLSMLFFCVVLQPSLRQLNATCAAAGGMARAGADDCYATAPPEVLFPAVAAFKEEVMRRAGLVLEVRKTKVYSADGFLHPAAAQLGFERAGVQVEGKFQPGFKCYGIPVGSDAFVKQVLEDKVKGLTDQHRVAMEVLGTRDRHSLWVGLRSSLSSQFDWLLQCCYPSQVEAAAIQMDVSLWSVLEAAVGQKIPAGWEPEEAEMFKPNVPAAG